MPIVDLDAPDITAPITTPKSFAVTPGAIDVDHGSDAPVERPAWSATFGAAFRQDNTVGAYFAGEDRDAPTFKEPGFNPWDAIKGTKYEPHWDSFVDVRNTRHADLMKQKIDRENEDRKTLDSAPWWQSIPSQMVAGVADLPSLIPGGAFYRGAKGGFALGKSALSVGAAAGVSTLAQETALQGLTETRTLGESGLNIGASVFLGGLLGAGGAKLLSRGEWARSVRDMNRNLHLGVDVPGTAVEGHLLSEAGVSGDVLADHFAHFEAYHGSPHDFDRFDISKIGTGEGAQAYGHGIYFAENAKVAEGYARRTPAADFIRKVRELYDEFDSPGDAHAAIAESDVFTASQKRLLAALEKDDWFGFDYPHQAVVSAIRDAANFDPSPETLAAVKELSNVYKVRINADHNHFLDWDKPLSEQSENVKRAFNAIENPMFEAWKKSGAWDHVKGETLYRELSGGLTNKAHADGLHVGASQALHEAGIPGIKYLDQGSRRGAADGVEGTRNFVVFDDKLVQITDKNGVPVAGMAGSNAPTSAGAAANLPTDIEGNTIAGRAAGAVAASTKRINPALRILQSPSPASREVGTQLFENSLYLKKNFEGVASEPAVETLMKEWNGGLATAVRSTDAEFKEYSKAGGQLGRDEFRQAVGKAMRRGDLDPDPHVAKVAQAWRSQVFDPLKEAAIKAGLLPEDVSVETAASYFSRMWNRNKLIAQEGTFKGVVRQWVEQSAPKWAEQFDKATERKLNPLRREIDELEMAKLRRGEEAKQRNAAGEVDNGEFSEADIRQAIRMVQGGAEKPKGVQTLTQFVHAAGGVVDHAGELRHMGINNKTLPGFVRKTQRRIGSNDGGWDLDSMARHAWESGYFPEHLERPLVNDFLEALADDFHKTRAVVREGDRDAYKMLELVHRLEDDLARVGVDTGKDAKAPRFSTSEEVKGIVSRVYKAMDAEADQKIAGLKAKLAEREAARGTERDAAFVGDPKELGHSIANEVFNTLTGKTEQTSRPEFITVKARGPLKERTFNIPDELVEDFLEHDVELVGRRYARVMGADVELANKFGSPDMAEQIQKIRDDYARLRQGVTSEKQLTKLGNAEKADVRDLEALRDQLRGTRHESPVEQSYARIVRAANQVNYIRSMGEVVLASLTDAIRPAWMHGLSAFMGGVGQLMTNMKGIKLSVAEAQLAGNVTERVLGHRLATISEIIDPYTARGPTEKFLENMTNVASKWNGIRIWTDAMKSISSVLTQDRILKNVEKFSGVKPKERAYLAYLGIDQSMAERIAEQFATHGETVDKVRVANTAEWTDPVAVRTYRAAINKDVDSIIVQKSVADVPLLANTPTGKALLQFKSFALASHQKVLLRGLQEDQARFVGGTVAMTMMGMFITYMKAISGNRPETQERALNNPGWWIGEGWDRAGVASVPMELANAFEKFTGFNPIKSPIKAFDTSNGISQKNQNRNDIGSLLGPSIGGLGDTITALGIPKKMYEGEDVTTGQKNAAERLLPFNSYLGLRQFIRYVANPPN